MSHIMMREYHVRFCEGLGVKFPGPTRRRRFITSFFSTISPVIFASSSNALLDPARSTLTPRAEVGDLVFFQHALAHERSGMSHWRKRIGDHLDILLQESLRIAHDTGALKKSDLARVTPQ